MAATLTISEMAVIFAVTPRALRFYEARGLLVPTRIGTHRLYDAKDQIRLQLILKGKNLGFTLDEIAKLFVASGKVDDAQLRFRREDVERKLSLLVRKREHMDIALRELRDRLEQRTA